MKLLVLSGDIFCKKSSHFSSYPKFFRSLEEIESGKEKIKMIKYNVYQIKAN